MAIPKSPSTEQLPLLKIDSEQTERLLRHQADFIARIRGEQAPITMVGMDWQHPFFTIWPNHCQTESDQPESLTIWDLDPKRFENFTIRKQGE